MFGELGESICSPHSSTRNMNELRLSLCLESMFSMFSYKRLGRVTLSFFLSVMHSEVNSVSLKLFSI